MMAIPVIAIDGPSASGKGTVAALVAQKLGYHYLDSGALYRLTAVAAQLQNVAVDDETSLAQIALDLDVVFAGQQILLDGNDVSDALRSEAAGVGASKIAVLAKVRAALLDRQHAFRQAPGLVADGRDMGSVVFPDAQLKIFLTASAEERSQRRYKQLIEKGISANLADLLNDLRDRDARDSARTVAPLRQEDDAILLDTTEIGIADAVNFVLKNYELAAGVQVNY
ncbi:(d)CMP kinase [Sulfuriferula nivalis]|uniref:Cytidylate kinase n=1 Tax=Sulfuriferula nivalis TaxID=2675298 RepID=A0A809S9U5_9PROT|nr:(d)CMP kinase [Sulfuriferula nivalis]BBP01152.1 cytidylate kinase [Sulfuriferula nivalis]